MGKQIRLYKSPDAIMAEFTVDGWPDKSISDVMGTHILPTAYTNKESLVEAGHAIGLLNPGYIVTYHL